VSGFSISLLKDKVALHLNGGEILNGRAQRCGPAPEPARAKGSHPGVSFSIPFRWRRHPSVPLITNGASKYLRQQGHPTPASVTTAVPFSCFPATGRRSKRAAGSLSLRSIERRIHTVPIRRNATKLPLVTKSLSLR
jgi:hypothetical protein